MKSLRDIGLAHNGFRSGGSLQHVRYNISNLFGTISASYPGGRCSMPIVTQADLQMCREVTGSMNDRWRQNDGESILRHCY